MLKILGTLFLSALVALGSNVRVGGQIDLNGKHTLYLLSASSEAIIVDLNEKSYKEFVYLAPLYKGESVTLSDPSDIEAYLKKTHSTLVYSETVGEIVNEYYYSGKISAYMSINGQKVNVHVSKNKDSVTVGVPLIFGSY